jgi:hypothetical protein
MKEYPHILGKIQDITVYCFPKYDGSNLRSFWTNKKGFCKFGTRTCLVDETNNIGKLAIPLIKIEEEIVSQYLKEKGFKEVTLFWEFFGSSSFAGYHDFEAKDHEVRLIDISVFKQGFLNPKDFIDLFENYERVAPCIYHGKMNRDIIKLVKEGKLEGQSYEGIVCKANRPRPNCSEPIMFKAKSNAWIDMLHKKFKDKPELIKELL